MLRSIKIFVALFCIICILALCVAPYADIPATVLKTLQVVVMLVFAAITSLLVAGLFSQVLSASAEPPYIRKSPTRSLLLPLDSSCVQQC